LIRPNWREHGQPDRLPAVERLTLMSEKVGDERTYRIVSPNAQPPVKTKVGPACGLIVMTRQRANQPNFPNRRHDFGILSAKTESLQGAMRRNRV
jgi:hypothetical protein